MRKLLIEDTPTPQGRGRDRMGNLIVALCELYKDVTYRNKILDILLEEKLVKWKPHTGRPSIPLWEIFVLAQIRLSK
jgi:hypothetical protein